MRADHQISFDIDVSVGLHVVALQFWPSQIELQSYLDTCRNSEMLRGHQEVEPLDFLSAVVVGQGTNVPSYGVGVGIEVRGAGPVILAIPHADLLAVGIQDSLIGVSTLPPGLRFNVELEGLVQAIFLRDPEIVVIHEIGASLISLTGETTWSRGTDLVRDWVMTESDLVLDTESGSVRLDLTTVDR